MNGHDDPREFSTHYINAPFTVEHANKSKKCCTCKCCSFFTLILTIFLLILIIGGAFYVAKDLANTCVTEECSKSVVEIYNFIDPNVNPCNDFQAFVCGKYLNSTENLETPSSPSLIQSNRIQKEIDSFITEKQSKYDSHLILMQKKFFRACMDEKAIDDDNLKFWNIIENIFGGWPLMLGTNWKGHEFDWLKTIIAMKVDGIPFQWFYVFGVSKTTGRNYLKITSYQQCESLYHMTDDAAYINLMEEAIMALTSMKQKTVRKEIEKMRPFVRKFTTICNDNLDVPLSPDTLENFKYRWDRFNLFEFINNMNSFESNSTDLVRVDHNINHYTTQLDALFTMFSKRDQANYLIWRIIEYYGQYLSSRVRTHFQYYANTKHYGNRFEFCLSDTKHRFPYLSETEFIRKTVNTPNLKSNIQRIFNYTREALILHLGDTDLHDDEWKRENIERVAATHLIIGGDKQIFDEEFENEYLKIGHISEFVSNQPLAILSEIEKAHWEVVLGSIGKVPINQHYKSLQELFERYVKIEPYYDNYENSILLPAGLLSGFYYNQDRHHCFNYATVGQLIGEMLMDVVNLTSSINDKDVKCPIGKIAEIYSVQLAYEGFKLWLETNSLETTWIFPLNYTFNQLFWIKSGMQWCTRIPYYLTQITNDPKLYEMSETRINRLVQNSKDFSKDFKCGRKTHMNPPQKCKVF